MAAPIALKASTKPTPIKHMLIMAAAPRVDFGSDRLVVAVFTQE